MKKAIFLDRDGVLNKAIVINNRPYSPRDLNEVYILDNVKKSIEKLKANKFEIVVITNQPDIASKKITYTFVDSLHNVLREKLKIKHFYVCPHIDTDHCECRKPKAGMIHKAAKDLGLDLHSSFLVGDRWKDIQAGQAAGLTSFFIDNKYSERMPVQPYFSVSSLFEAVNLITGWQT